MRTSHRFHRIHRILLLWKNLPQIAQIFTEPTAENILPQIAQIHTDANNAAIRSLTSVRSVNSVGGLRSLTICADL